MRMESNSKNNTKLGKLKKKQKLLLKTNGKTEQVLKKLKRKLDMAESDEKGNLTEESGNTVDKNVCLEGMTAAEMAMVRKLAGNDPVVRKKTLRKLKKWLGVLAMKVSDGEDCRDVIEPNFIRVWKALFYCMWMADKPLPQEQLAESLSDLQFIFASKTYPFLIFVEWFIRTVAREWSWIDRLRMDKFMMLFRRFLRKTLIVLSEKKWRNDFLQGYLSIVATHIFNRRPLTKKQKRKDSEQIVHVPLGFQIHFIDVFMEELAKIGGEDLKFQKILKILGVFVQELAYNGDDRVLDEIKERVFCHLMRQSDVGMDYEEQRMAAMMDDEEDLEEEDEENEAEADNDKETDELIGDIEGEFETENIYDEEENIQNGILDPRAGGIDVILPQLQVDYEILYKKLIEFGGQKDLKLKNRRILYSLASQFREITEGKYPLALPEDNIRRLSIPRKEVKKAAKRLVALESGEDGDVIGKKNRKNKKMRRKEAKRKLMNSSSISENSVGSEDDSQYINDEELLEHVSDNYMSYITDQITNDENQADEMDGLIQEEGDQNETDNDNVFVPEEEELEETKVGKLKKKKKDTEEKFKKRKWKTVVEVEADENENCNDDSIKMTRISQPETNTNEEQEESVILMKAKKPKLGKRSSLGSNEKPSTPLMGKMRRLSELKTPVSKSSPRNNLSGSFIGSPANKRVSFVLAKNLEHEHADYPVSIARSPSIPFDKNKRPSFGLLKSPSTTPKSTPLKVKRASAIDFF